MLEEIGKLLGLTDPAGSDRESCKHAESGRYERGPWHASFRPLTAPLFLSREGSDDARRNVLQMTVGFFVRSLFERCVADPAVAGGLCRKLQIQRRMLPDIAELVREPVYGGAYESPALDDLASCGVKPSGLSGNWDRDVPFLDTSRYNDCWDKPLASGFNNPGEAKRIIAACRAIDRELMLRGETGRLSVSKSLLLCRASDGDQKGLRVDEDGAPFRCLELEEGFGEKRRPRIVPIDRIQGQETDIVFISFVRVRQGQSALMPGFAAWLQDYRRLNVACTRAHRLLVLVGHRPMLKRMAAASELDVAKRFDGNLLDRVERQTGRIGLMKLS